MSGYFFNQPIPVGADFRVIGMDDARSAAKLVPIFVDIGLEFQSKQSLIVFDDKMRSDSSEKIASDLTGELAIELDAVFRISQVVSVGVETAAVGGVEILDNGPMCHADTANYLVSDMPRIGLFPSTDADKTLSVEKAGSVNVVHISLAGDVGIVANSVKLPCPTERCGRTIPSQAGARQALGVCNEHVPLAEAEMCSGLYGNIQKSAEMTGSDDVFTMRNIHHQATDCNTDYLFLRPHQDRNMTPLDPDRFSVNQDAMVKLIAWAGNMAMSNRFLQGVITA